MIRAARVVPAVLAEVIRKAPLCPEKVEFAWRCTVGPAVDRVTEVHLADGGVLQVTAADIHWAHEIKRSARLITRRLASLLGDGIVVRLEVR